MRLDLHTHSTASDGAWPPERLAQEARAGGLDVIALTDHDTTAGVAEAVRAGADCGLDVIPGVEVSSTHGQRDIHVLGYGVDPAAAALRNHEARARDLRRRRMAEMVERLGRQGVEVRLERVLEVGGGAAAVARPHLARVLVEEGYASEISDAFDRYIGDGHPAFVPTALQTPAEAVSMILESGGVPVWAHPPRDLLDVLLVPMIGAGLRGLECRRPGNSPALTRRLLGRARTAGLLPTGGSDWHNPERNAPLGTFWVTGAQVKSLLDALRGAA